MWRRRAESTFLFPTYLGRSKKIQEGLQQLCDGNFYKPLTSPIVLDTARKVKAIIKKLLRAGNIDKNDLQMIDNRSKVIAHTRILHAD